jgi:glycosyltransferase involved in cell wall biosynthesis
VGGLLDFVRHDENGLICRPHDPESLARALEELLADAARRAALAARARASVASVYDERTVFGRFADLVRAFSGGRR